MLSLLTLPRLAAAAVFAGGLLLVGAAPAMADTTIPINPGNVPTTAAGFGTHECTQTGTSPDQDGWVFVLPGNKGSFVSLTLTFTTADGMVTLNIPADGGAIISDNGTSKAWIVTPAGWTLIDASATITGRSANGFFVLTHTCPATSSPSPSPSSPPPTTSGSPSSSGSSSPATALMTAVQTPPGAAIGLLVTGGTLLGAAGTLISARRRRDREV